jgi:thiol-disulfide isomerase/thioredoxin
MVGKNAKPIQSKLLNGEDFKLADHQGKVVVLDFWATWCGPCVQALPELLQATSSFNDDQVKLIAVNQGEAKKVISKFLASKQLESLEVALDRNRKIGSDYGVQGIPRTVVIDPKGVIREVHVGYAPGMGERLRLEIENLLAE